MSIFSLFSHNLVKQSYIFFDFETTGLYPLASDRIIEIAMIKTVDGKIVDTLESMINPQMPIPEEASQTNNITDEMVADAPLFNQEFAEKVLKFVEKSILVAHNASFDLSFLSMEMARNGISFENWVAIDTLKIAQAVFTGQRNNLNSLMKRYNITPNGDLHRAIVDTEVLKKVYFELVDEQDIREYEIEQIIKRFGFQGNNLPRFIPGPIREALIEKSSVKGDYLTRDRQKIQLDVLPICPVWCNNRWFLYAKDNQNGQSMILYCKRFLEMNEEQENGITD
ncbi:MAG: 3'-5' exonuclease [Spirochaetes bacterium]|nr:3'-5' exonuclease [Spirochaetota bacterium]